MTKPYNFRNITSADAGTTVVVRRKGDTPTPGMFSHVTIGTTSAHALAFYNNESAVAADKIGTLKVSIVENTYRFETAFDKGLCVVVPAGYVGDATVAFI